MRDWNLGAGDPLSLTIAADARLCEPDYTNDHIWELSLEGGNPPGLALQTMYGLRAGLMRIFPRFILNGQARHAPASFAVPPRVVRFYPNYLQVKFAPFPGFDIQADYWIPSSQSAAGRLTITNSGSDTQVLFLELCALLIPLEGQSIAPLKFQSASILTGRTSEITPVVFLTGGPQPGPGPYPALSLDLRLEPGAARTLTWTTAALKDLQSSFELARRIAARRWEAERAAIELLAASQSVDIQTGDAEWDAALALSQKAALGLFQSRKEQLPDLSFVTARRPDHGYSRRGDGNDYPATWTGQSAFDALYLAGLLPGAPRLVEGLLRNFLNTQNAEDFVNGRPGLGGQRARWLATPLLASLAWQAFRLTGNIQFLEDVFPRLLAFYQHWFTPAHDRDGDGFPEWDLPLQTGFEDHPAFTLWHAWGQGAAISNVEDPAMGAMLYREGSLLLKMADLLGQVDKSEMVSLRQKGLRRGVEECWDPGRGCYRLRDRDSHQVPAGHPVGSLKGGGILKIAKPFTQPARLLVIIQFGGTATRHPEILLKGKMERHLQVEKLERVNFQWSGDRAVATSSSLFTRLDRLETSGLGPKDRITLRTLDLSLSDQTSFLPLWAGLPDEARAQALVEQGVFDSSRFGRPYGIPILAQAPRPSPRRAPELDAVLFARTVHLPWNVLVGQGMLAYGRREDAARLLARLMGAVIDNLKKQQAFFQAYDAETGMGVGEPNSLAGMAPVGFFLDTLGVQFVSPASVRLRGKNPFPWPVVVKYRGTRVTRRLDSTEVIFPDGKVIALNDPTDALVSCE
jgi:hypothetical protein